MNWMRGSSDARAKGLWVVGCALACVDTGGGGANARDAGALRAADAAPVASAGASGSMPAASSGGSSSGAAGLEGSAPSGLAPVAGAGGGAGESPGTDGTRCELPESFAWSSSAPLIVPVSDPSHDLVAVKDPSVVRFNDRWHVYASSVTRTGVYGMVYVSFADWAQAGSAPLYYMDQTPGFDTYVAAPQLFYFQPQAKWYLVFQSGPPMYSTADDPGDPTQWTRPAPFFATTPAIIAQGDGWLDFWVICDAARCHLFASDDHGRWYRSSTSVAEFPRGFDEPIVVMQDPEAGRLFEGSAVYQLSGANGYLALIEAFDSTSNWRRYYRSWTAPSLDGPWQPLRDSGSAPFASSANVTFQGAAWTLDISHGELVRAGFDQRMQLDPCNLQLMYQGYEPTADTSNYNAIPWQLGLLTAAQ